MLPFDLRPADIDTVNIQRKNHSCPTVRDRLWVLWMVHLGFARQDAAAAVGCCNNSVTNYVRMYQDGGLEAVMTTAYQRNDHPLADRFDEVRQGLVDACIHTLGEARSWLAEQYDYLVSRESVRKLLHRLGLKRRKVNPFPGKPKDIDAWMEAQRCWIDHLHDLHHRAATEELDFLFCDAAHFVYGKFDNYLWSDGPRFQPSGHGRHRLRCVRSL